MRLIKEAAATMAECAILRHMSHLGGLEYSKSNGYYK